MADLGAAVEVLVGGLAVGTFTWLAGPSMKGGAASVWFRSLTGCSLVPWNSRAHDTRRPDYNITHMVNYFQLPTHTHTHTNPTLFYKWLHNIRTHTYTNTIQCQNKPMAQVAFATHLQPGWDCKGRHSPPPGSTCHEDPPPSSGPIRTASHWSQRTRHRWVALEGWWSVCPANKQTNKKF
jgi:hypothetical protein